MSIYNLTAVATNMSSGTNAAQAFNNEIFNGLLGFVILLVIFFITFTSFITRTGDPNKSYMASSWICALCAILLRIVGLMNDYILFGVIVVAALSLFVDQVSK